VDDNIRSLGIIDDDIRLVVGGEGGFDLDYWNYAESMA
jgi:hypothetical protein